MKLSLITPHCSSFFFLMIRLPPRSTRTDTLFPYTTLFRSSTNKVYGDLTGVELAMHEASWQPVDAGLAAAGVNESQPLAFCTPYGCSKGAADQYVLDYAHHLGVPACVFRMS